MTNKMVIIYGCQCHKGQMYALNEDNRVVRVLNMGDLPLNFLVSYNEFKYKEIDDIHDLITAVLT